VAYATYFQYGDCSERLTRAERPLSQFGDYESLGDCLTGANPRNWRWITIIRVGDDHWFCNFQSPRKQSPLAQLEHPSRFNITLFESTHRFVDLIELSRIANDARSTLRVPLEGFSEVEPRPLHPQRILRPSLSSLLESFSLRILSTFGGTECGIHTARIRRELRKSLVLLVGRPGLDPGTLGLKGVDRLCLAHQVLKLQQSSCRNGWHVGSSGCAGSWSTASSTSARWSFRRPRSSRIRDGGWSWVASAEDRSKP